MYKEFVEFVKSIYPKQQNVLLHAPVFIGNEKKYLIDCIDTTFVSYVGQYVTKFEELTAQFTGAKYAIAVVNGTAALQIALQLSGVKRGDEVITQPLTFVATANAIVHCGAEPVFVDVDVDTMGMSPEKLEYFLVNNSILKDGICINKITGNRIAAIVPMHTFGFPCRIIEIKEVADKYNIPIVEDAAESLGSYYNGKHTGVFGAAGILSYNGNKTITTGGGGMIITDDEELAKRAKRITTTAKIPHRYEYIHDEVAYNYRLTNLNAALGVAQMELMDEFLKNKRETKEKYAEFFKNSNVKLIDEAENSTANFWLNAILLNSLEERNEFLEFTNDNGVMTRPIWHLMNKLEMFKHYLTGNLDNSIFLESRIVNIPSGYRQ